MVHGSILNRFIYRFEKTISEDNCYIMRNVSIGDYPNKIKYVNNTKKVNLYMKSFVEPCDDFGGDRNGFRLVDVDLLINSITPPGTILDVVAFVSFYQPISQRTTKDGKIVEVMNLRLKGLRDKNKDIALTLWGKYAVQVSDYILSYPEPPPMFILLKWALYKANSDGSPSLCNTVNSCKLYINEDIQEINDFKNKYVEFLFPESSSSSQLSGPTVRLPLRDEFLNANPFYHIIELDEFKEPKQVIICGRIRPMSKFMQWYYVSCKQCHRAVKEKVSDDGCLPDQPEMNQFRVKYFCYSKCNGAEVEAVPRYRINFAVQDSTGVHELCLWEGVANRILKISSYEMLLKLTNAPLDHDVIPQELRELENRIFAFKISINDYNINNKRTPINIVKMTDDSFIVAELQNTGNMSQQLEESDSVNVGGDTVNVGGSEDSFGKKVGNSLIDDNINAIEKSTGKSVAVDDSSNDSKFSTPMPKRNLNDVYDVDNPPSESATKSVNAGATGSKSVNGKFEFKIPKLEK